MWQWIKFNYCHINSIINKLNKITTTSFTTKYSKTYMTINVIGAHKKYNKKYF